jgi:signal transduction histidine kinase
MADQDTSPENQGLLDNTTDLTHRTDNTPANKTLNKMQEKAIASLAALSYRTGELQDYLNQICKAVLDVLGDGAAAVTLYRNGKKNVIAREPHSPKVGVPLDIHGHLSTFVVDSGEILRVEDALENPQYGNPPAGYCSYLGIPLKLPNGEVVGTLCYFDENTRDYSDHDAQVASLFAERIAIALDNYELYLQLKEHSENLEAKVEERSQELLAARDALAQKEKLAAIGEFATGLTHEIRNPLATIRLALEYFDRQGDDRASKRAQLASNEVSRLERMLNEVLTYARPANLSTKAVDLGQFVDAFLKDHACLAEPKQQTLELNLSCGNSSCESPSLKNTIQVQADSDKLTQILLNLIGNACDAADFNQAIHCSISEDEHFGILQVQNQGAIIPPEKLSTITGQWKT